MKYCLYATLAFLAILSCKTNSKNNSNVNSGTVSLRKMWESDTVFTTAESALYDAATSTIYVSNIEANPWVLDGKGSIGKLSPTGKVIDARWITGLNAPKGMAITNGKLFVADIDKLVEIDLAAGKIVKKHEVPGCEGLNDVTSTPDGSIYFTDSKKGVVHLLKNGNVSTIVTGLGYSNGIFYEKSRLMLGTWKDSSLIAYNFKDKTLQKIANPVPQPDGVEAMGNGDYLVSSWKGLVHHVQANGKATLLLDTSNEKVNAADIDYVADKKMLLVPTFFRNSVVAYQVVTK
jgi:streptogramin lyase